MSTQGKTADGIMINREYKDRLFRMLFGNEKYKGELLQLYNALNDSSYTNEDELEINTIEDVIYMKMKNDVSFILKSTLTLLEQQSTFNPNMPLRGFMYFSKLYDKIIDHGKMYATKLVKIPAPQYYVFYNGDENHGDVEYLKLSDAFETTVTGFEWTATMLNVNKGHNMELMNKCSALRDYADFLDAVKTNKKEMGDIRQAIDHAVNEFIKRPGTLSTILRENKMEVVDVMLTEYDEEAVMNMLREEAREEGIGIGVEKGREEGIGIGVEKGRELTRQIFQMSMRGMSMEEISKATNQSVAYVKETLYGGQ